MNHAGITRDDARLLAVLRQQGEGTGHELAVRAELNPLTVSRQLRRLHTLGLIVGSVPSGQRAIVWSLNPTPQPDTTRIEAPC